MLEKFIKGAIVKHFWWEEKNLVSTNQSLNTSKIFLIDKYGCYSCFGIRVCYYVLLSANVDVTIMYH